MHSANKITKSYFFVKWRDIVVENYKTQCCQDENFPQIHLLIHYNLNRNTSRTFVEINELILKFVWKSNRTIRVKVVPPKRNRQLILLLAQLTSYKAIKLVLYWQQDRHIDQQDRIDSPKIEPYTHGQMISTEVQMKFNRGKRLYSISGSTSQNIWMFICKKERKKDSQLIPHTI